jgi:hypothetical protein
MGDFSVSRKPADCKPFCTYTTASIAKLSRKSRRQVQYARELAGSNRPDLATAVMVDAMTLNRARRLAGLTVPSRGNGIDQELLRRFRCARREDQLSFLELLTPAGSAD